MKLFRPRVFRPGVLKIILILAVPAIIALIFGLAKTAKISPLGTFLRQNSFARGAAAVLAVISEKINEKEDAEINFVRPEIIKGVYLTGWSAGSRSRIDYLISLAKTTQINAVVIDIKDSTGSVSYSANDEIAPKVKEYGAKNAVKIADIDGLVKKLHKEGIYVIGRIVVFQDPILAFARPDVAVLSKSELSLAGGNIQLLSPLFLWLDRSRLAWIDPASEESWDYNIAIAKDALSRGFDEINFDYVRFPSDGDLKNMSFSHWNNLTPKHLVVKDFFRKTREKLPEAILSVDLFGLSTVNHDDLGIGQVMEDVFDYFDYICPMVYPSHYASGFLGYGNPALYPYQVIKYSMSGAFARLKNYQLRQSSDIAADVVAGNEEEPIKEERKVYFRPWLQDFNLGAVYGSGMVQLETRAVIDSLGEDFKGFLLWNPRNIYTKDALLKELILQQ